MQENLIKEVLKELNSISYPDFVKKVEIIIVDDFSTDNSYAVVKEYSKDFS
ncbi:MAG: glycosyltransferase [Bacteroidetes bacterium]|nr:glycosyltransferase [Bacteroidota bacterium]